MLVHTSCCFTWFIPLLCPYFIWQFDCSFSGYLHFPCDMCSMRIKAFSVCFIPVSRVLQGMLTVAQYPLNKWNSRCGNLRQFPPSPEGHIWIRCSWYLTCSSNELWRSSALVLPTMLDRWMASHSQNIKNDGKLLISELEYFNMRV